MQVAYSSPKYREKHFVVFNKSEKKISQSARDFESIQKRIRSNSDKLEYVSSYIDRYFGTHVTSAILLSLARIIVENYNIKIDRLAKRNRSALLCWYAENWTLIHGMLKGMSLSSLMNLTSSPTSDADIEKNSEPIVEQKYVDPLDISSLLNMH